MARGWNTGGMEDFCCPKFFVDELREIQIPSHRRKENGSSVSQQEQTELRGLLVGLGWKCEQTGLQHSAATGLQHSRIEQATVQDMTEGNRPLQQVKKKSRQAIRIFTCPTEEHSALIGLGDAALQKRSMAIALPLSA